jgi:hypothetical protein
MRKMSRKERLVVRDVLEGSNGLALATLEDAIDQQERIAMRQLFEHRIDIEGNVLAHDLSSL